MRNTSKQIALFFVIWLLLQTNVQALAQDVGTLQRDQLRIQQKLEEGQRTLRVLDKGVSGSLQQVRVLEEQIKLRRELMDGIQEQLAGLEIRARESASVLEQLGNDLQDSRNEYAQLVQWVYRKRSTKSQLLFVLGSSSWNQAYKRVRYLLQLTEFRQKQAQLILYTKLELQQTQDGYEAALVAQKTVVQERASEREKLQNERNRMNQKIARLRKDRAQVTQELNENKQQESRIAKLIKDLLLEKAQAVTGSGALEKLWKKLRKPVSGGISRKFGKWHDEVTGTDWVWNGIDISTAREAAVQSVCAGEVRMVAILPGKGRTVMVKSGAYIVVYANLNTVDVKVGDKLKIGEEFGRLVVSNSQSTLHFQIWKDGKPQDPEPWFAR